MASYTELQASLLLGDVMRVLDERPDARRAGLEALATHDAEQGSELSRSLLGYLYGFGDVARGRSKRSTFTPIPSATGSVSRSF